MFAELTLLTDHDPSKLIRDAQRVKYLIESDDCDTLRIILENKFSQHAQAFRLVKRYCLDHEISWAIKRACDVSLYIKEQSADSVVRFCDHIINSEAILTQDKLIF